MGHIRLTLAIPKMEKHKIAELESCNLYNMNQNKEALVYARKSIAMRNRVGEELEMAYSLNTLALIYNSLGEKNRSVSLWDKAIRILTDYGWTESMEIQTMKENRRMIGMISSH